MRSLKCYNTYMREINVREIEDKVCEAAGTMAFSYTKDIQNSIDAAIEKETQNNCRMALEMLKDNAAVAKEQRIPLCQDTGMVTVYTEIGQEVHFSGNLHEAIINGVAEGTKKYLLRASVVADPLFNRKNTGDNTPCIIYDSIVPGNCVRLKLCTKGFGSENMSALKMLKPSDGIEGVRDFVLQTIGNAGPNACPPMIAGVGIGGTFDYAAYLAKRALLYPIDSINPDPKYAALEEEWKKAADDMHIGTMGLGGNTTVLRIRIEPFPTHIAGLPCAVNLCCHASRHTEVIL